MAAPVWSLSVNLETKTAVFQTGLADAAKAARSSFGEIRDAAGEMSGGVAEAASATEYSMTGARHSVVMLGEEFGIHLPRGITTFIASLGPVGAAMEAAFPFLAIILGATLLIEHLTKIGEAAEKAAEAGRKLDDDMTVGGDKAKLALINAEIEADKLAGKIVPVELLSKKLELEGAIKGVQQLDELGKKLDEVIKAHGPTSNWNPFNWLDHSDDLAAKAKALQAALHGKSDTDQVGILSATLTLQSHVLEQMSGQRDISAAQLSNQASYVDWLQKETAELQNRQAAEAQQGKNKDTKDTQDSAKKAEEAQERLAAAQQRGLDHRMQIEAEYTKRVAELHKKAAEETEKDAELELHATEAVSKELADQAKEQARIAQELGKEEAEHTKKMAALQLQEEQQATKEAVKLKRSRSEQVLAEQIQGENAAYAADMRAYQIELNSLDKYGKDYEVKVKQLQDRELELTRSHENKLTEIKAQATEERNARILAADHRFEDDVAQGLTKTLTGHESFGKMMRSIGNEVATGMMENAIKSVLANDFTKESDAAAAARRAYLGGPKDWRPYG